MAKKRVFGPPTTRGGGLIEQLGRRQNELITFKQIELCCKHLLEHIQIGTREDLAARTLDSFIDNYAKMYFGGSSSVHSIKQVHPDYWSHAAKSAELDKDVKKHVEHGTPRPHLRRRVIDIYRERKLTEKALIQIIKRYYVLAVVTEVEHRGLDNKTTYPDPFARWTAGNISFPADPAKDHWPKVP